MKNTATPPTLALPATVAFQGGNIICVMETARPASPYWSYWTDWGGTYDMPDTSQILLFFDGFLHRVESAADLLSTHKSYYVEGTRVYIHLPRYPWTYSPEHTQRKPHEG